MNQTRTTPTRHRDDGGAWRGLVVLPTADGQVSLLRDGVVRWRDGRIVDLDAGGTTTAEAAQAPRPGNDRAMLIAPAFVDLHCHWSQGHVRGRFSGNLLDWLRDSIWPAEAELADMARARQLGEDFLAALLGAGTGAALLFGPPFLAASERFLAIAPRGFFDGPAIMERNGPESMLRPATEMLDSIAALAPDCRQRIAISPRFAPNLSEAGLERCAEIAGEFGLLCQSHLSESLQEVAWVRELFPEARDYTDVYDQAGLLGPRFVVAHGVHLRDRELQRLAETRTVLAHCPTSNEALSSGRMPLERVRRHGVRWVLATDVGAGPLLSQWDTIRACLEVHARERVEVAACEAFCRATVIPGSVLADQDRALAGLGTLQTGAPAHLVAYSMPAGCDERSDAEEILRSLAFSDRDDLEQLPDAIVHWGRPFDIDA